MKMNPEGMELFKALCKRLEGLNLITEGVMAQNESRAEMVSFFYNQDIRQMVTDPRMALPVASVQVIADNQNLLKNEVVGVSLKFYQSPLLTAGLTILWDNHRRYRTELQGPPESPYYNYIFVDPYSREHVYEYIDDLFTSLHKELKHLQLTGTKTNEDLVLA